MWGLVFVAPLILADYPAAWLTAGRYLAFGFIALPLAWWDRAELARLSAADWIESLKLSAIGNLLYYLLLSAALQRAGGPLPTIIIGSLPVVIAIAANLRRTPGAPRLSWSRMLPSLLLLTAGIAAVNHGELNSRATDLDVTRHAIGALLAAGAVLCWTWYPIRNGEWLRAHPSQSPRAWATAQGLTTLPLASVGALLYGLWIHHADPGFALPFGPSPGRFVLLMLAIGLFASWLGTLCWNEASQRLPPALAGQLIVFETLAALAYAFVLRGEWPPLVTLAGAALLVIGVMLALRPQPDRGTVADSVPALPH